MSHERILEPYLARALFDALDDALCVFEPLPLQTDGRRDYRYVAMNAAMERMFGVSNLCGLSIRDSFPEEAEAWYDDYDRVLRTGESIRIERVSEPQGITLEMLVMRLDTGDTRRLLALMRDVTDRARAARALTESEARLGLLLSVSDAIRSLVDACDIQYTACRILAEHLDVERAYYVEIDEDAGTARVTRDVVRNNAPSLAGEHRIADFGWSVDILRRGECHVVDDTRTSPVVSDADRPASLALRIIACAGAPLIRNERLVGAVCVTDARPRAWSTLEVRLIHEVAQRIRDAVERGRAETALRQREEELRTADRRKDEFLAMLGHELRNPLAPIRTGLELIRVGGNTPAAVNRVRQMLERQVEHIVRLTDDLLDVGRITAGRIQLQREPTPLGTLIAAAVDAHRAPLEAAHLSITVDLPDTASTLDVDPTRFVQVVSNLLHNAIKFTPAGGAVHIRGAIGPRPGSTGSELTLLVADTGIGISPEFLPRMFDLFTQAGGPSSQPGLGIGLALARTLVELQDGTIEARSEGLGHGTEFRLRFPVSVDQSSPTVAREREELPLSCAVVVVDDNRDAAQSVVMLVQALGGHCTMAFNGESALHEVAQARPDVVLLDVGMPGMDGYEVCRRLRGAHGTSVAIIALSGFGQPADKARARAAGFDTHLTKPVDPSALLRVLRTSVRHCSAEAERS